MQWYKALALRRQTVLCGWCVQPVIWAVWSPDPESVLNTDEPLCPAVVAGALAGARLQIPIHGGTAATRALRPDGGLRPAPCGQQPPLPQLQQLRRRPGGGGVGLPPFRICTAFTSDGTDHATLSVVDPVYCRRAQTGGQPRTGTAVLQPFRAGALACCRGFKLEWVGTHACWTKSPLCGCYGQLPVRGRRGGGTCHRTDVCGEDGVPVRSEGEPLDWYGTDESVQGALCAGSSGTVSLRRRGEEWTEAGSTQCGALLSQEKQVDLCATVWPLAVLSCRLCGGRAALGLRY